MRKTTQPKYTRGGKVWVNTQHWSGKLSKGVLTGGTGTMRTGGVTYQTVEVDLDAEDDGTAVCEKGDGTWCLSTEVTLRK